MANTKISELSEGGVALGENKFKENRKLSAAIAAGEVVDMIATGAEVTSVTCVATALMTTSDYFLINCPTVENYVWFQIDAAGADPAPGGTGIKIDIAAADTADQVAAKLQTKMDLEANYGASVVGAVVTITNAANGDVVDASDYNTDFIISVTTQGTSGIALSTAITGDYLGIMKEHEEFDLDTDIDAAEYGDVVTEGYCALRIVNPGGTKYAGTLLFGHATAGALSITPAGAAIAVLERTIVTGDTVAIVKLLR